MVTAPTAPTTVENLVVNIDADLSGLEQGFSAVTRNLKSFALGLIPPVSVAATFAAFRSALDSTAEVLDRLVDLNVSEELFRGLELGAQSSGIALATLDSALARFNRRVARAAQGGGAFASELQKSHKELLKQIVAADGLDAQLKVFADGIQNTTNEQEQLRLVSAAFGNEGESLIRILRDGSKGFEEFKKQAKDLGLVMGTENLDAAAALSSEMDKLQGVVGTQLRNAFTTAAVSMAEFFGVLETRRVSTIDAELAETTSNIEALATRIKELRAGAGAFGPGAGLNLRTAEISDQIALMKIREAELTAEREKAVENLEKYNKTGENTTKVLTDVEKAQDRLGDGITEVSRTLSEQEIAMSNITSRFQTHVENSFVQLATTGKINFKSLANSVIADLVRMTTQQLIFNTAASLLGGPVGGGLLGGLGSLFGGFFADGGRVQAGKYNIVGENGPEVFKSDTNGTIIPNDQLSSIRGNGNNATMSIIRLDGMRKDQIYTDADMRKIINRMNVVGKDMGFKFMVGA